MTFPGDGRTPPPTTICAYRPDSLSGKGRCYYTVRYSTVAHNRGLAKVGAFVAESAGRLFATYIHDEYDVAETDWVCP